MPWHLMEALLVQIFGLTTRALLRNKCMYPELLTLRKRSGFEVGIMDPVGKCWRWSKSNGDGKECRCKKSTTLFSCISVWDSVLSLGIKKVMFPFTRSSGAMLISIIKVK
uniref:Uncharacterized protein n=1 Tax=Solanum lycopersicum TaxID=4081 RepID=A0A3Q7GYW6_SOLLC